MTNHPLRRFRERAGLTLEQLAILADTSAASLSRIETGQQFPSFGLISRLARVSNGKLCANDFMQREVSE
jgi:transcriptional regulator with XRE-family HTH domain